MSSQGSPQTRGMRSPELAVGDEVCDFWAAVGTCSPRLATRGTGCYKSCERLDACQRASWRAEAAIREIIEAEDKAHARRAVEAFSEEFGVKWPRAAERITYGEEALLRYYGYPAEHWRHLEDHQSHRVAHSPA